MIQIHRFLPQAECEYSGRTGEAVEISTADGTVRQAVISIPELTKLLRFRHRQELKQSAPTQVEEGQLGNERNAAPPQV